ncbi:hypothetical protein F2Q70_00025121 [Brassica cretica]|uniref:Uncharacterized protein n=1 Tax=Brassica cretica TaxID=69181 RepID=A0A8S9LAH7_BRACR|nr:hypothetical protein F2Q70_00025121 [Brassica cretica]
MLHYADDILGHAGLPSHHVQVSRSQPCLAAQYRSMFRLKCLSISDGRYRSMEGCLRSTVESECRSMRLVSGSTVVDENRSMNLCCCRSMRSVFPCGLKVFNQMVLIFYLDMFFRSGFGYADFSDLEDFWEVF